MSVQSVQLLGRLERDMLNAQQELTDLKMETNDETTRKILMRAALAVKHLRDELENLVLDSMDDEEIPR